MVRASARRDRAGRRVHLLPSVEDVSRRRCCCTPQTPFNDDGVSVTITALEVECGVLISSIEATGQAFNTAEEALAGCFQTTDSADCDPDGIANSGDEFTAVEYNPPLDCIPKECGCDCSCQVDKDTSCPPEGTYATASSGSFFNSWTIPFVSRFDQANSGTWFFRDGTTVFGTGYTAFATANVERYEGNYDPTSSVTSGTTNIQGYLCCNDAATATTAWIRIEYVRNATYTQDIPVIRVQGSALAYKDWTVEITDTECVIRDNLGALAYTFLLSAYTIDGLRIALNNLTEVNAFRDGATVPTSNLRNVTAQYIPAQAAQTISHAGAGTSAFVDIRFAGDEVESYQKRLLNQRYSCYSGPGTIVLQGVVYKERHSGTENDFRFGWQLAYDTPAESDCDQSDPCCQDCNRGFFGNTGLPGWMTNAPNGACVPSEVGEMFYPQPFVSSLGNPTGWAENNVFCPTQSPFWIGGTTSTGWESSKVTEPATSTAIQVCRSSQGSLGLRVLCDGQYHCEISRNTATRLTRRMFMVQRNF